MFRYERPQAGRTRQFTQFGVEAIGAADPAIDAEIIALGMQFYENLGLKNLKLVINSLGDPESRLKHRDVLIAHFKPSIDEFCKDCQSRLEKNPMRILDCKVDRDHPLMATAPSILDYLNEESAAYFDKLQEYLTSMGMAFTVDPTMVRGLDYYNHTAFEIMGEGFGAITTLAGGGRYNGLVQQLGGPESPGIGFALSIERLLLALKAEDVTINSEKQLDCFLAIIGEKTKDQAPALLNRLRKNGVSADMDYLSRKVKGQFKQADRSGAKFVAVLGEEELEKQVINVKRLSDGSQTEVPIEELEAFIKNN